MKAKEVKRGTFFLEKGSVFTVVDVKHQEKYVQLTVDNFQTGHRSTRHFSNIHVLRELEPQQVHLTVVTLTDTTDDNFSMSLLTESGEEYLEDLHVSDDGIRDYLRYYFTENPEEPLKLMLTVVPVDAVHRNESSFTASRITKLEGYDLTHLYDHHHGHHHTHHVSHQHYHEQN